MKTKIMTQLTLGLMFLLFGCSNNTEHQDNLLKFAVFDSLQGTWNWHTTYDAKKGLIENEFQAKIKFLSINNDTTINYATYKNGTLYKSGKLKISNTNWGKKIEPDIIPNSTVGDEIYFEFVTIDSLRFYKRCNDCPFYYYSKSKL
jgi:hypothetical protein